MCMLDEIRAKQEENYAIAWKHKADKIWIFGSCACGKGRSDKSVGGLAEYARYNFFVCK